MGVKSFFSIAGFFVFLIIIFIYFTVDCGFENDFKQNHSEIIEISNDNDANFIKKKAVKKNIIKSSAKDNKKINNKIETSLIEFENLLEIFKMITSKFKDSLNMSSHFEEVYNYLEKNYSKERADFLFIKYSDFVKCSQELSEKLSILPMPVNKNEILDRIDFVEEFRKEFLGEELYFALYKDESKIKKFHIEKNSVIHDKNLYAFEKKELLSEINNKYNYEEKIKSPYERYMEALSINEKDMSELDEDEYRFRKEELKKEYFTLDILEKRRNLENEINLYENAVSDFNKEKEVLLENNNFTKEEKELAINILKKQIFNNNDLKRFERTEKIKTERKKLITKYGLEWYLVLKYKALFAPILSKSLILKYPIYK